MKLSKYPLKAFQDLTIFEFISEGPKGSIPKLIEFTETNVNGYYNLAFGDKKDPDGKLDDMAITNNNDTEKVLVTVVAAVYAFTDKYPDAFVHATGSTASRTRLYKMGINKYLEEVKRDFLIFGELDEQWVPFENDKNYTGFVVQRKKIIKFAYDN